MEGGGALGGGLSLVERDGAREGEGVVVGGCEEDGKGLAEVGEGLLDDDVTAGVGAGTVLKNEGRDAESVEEFGDVAAFFIDGEMAEAAAGGDEDGRAGRLGGEVGGEGGVGDVADTAPSRC